MCRVLEVGASGYYRWRSRQPSRRATENTRLLERITAEHAASRGLYGSPKVYRKLRHDGETVNHKRVERLVKEHGIKAKRLRSLPGQPIRATLRRKLPNVLERNFSVLRPNEVWTSDITYIWTDKGWLYLVVFLDSYSRLVVGWRVSERMRVEFVEAAFLQAQHRRASAVSPLVHSDRGLQ